MENFIPVVRVLLFFFLCIICLVPFVWLAEMHVLPLAPNQLLEDISWEVSILLAVLGGLLMMFQLFPNLDFYTVFVRSFGAFNDTLKGTGLGIGAVAVCSLLMYAGGLIKFSANGVLWDVALLYVFYYGIIALAEEFLFRSFFLFAFAEKYAAWFACLFNGLLFALLHTGNPNVNTIGLINIALVGTLLCIYTLQNRQLFWAVGIHLGWNLSQGLIFGYRVSGVEMKGFLTANTQGNPYFSGGAFGLEGSLFCTLILVCWLAFMIKNRGWGAMAHMDSLETEEAPSN